MNTAYAAMQFNTVLCIIAGCLIPYGFFRKIEWLFLSSLIAFLFLLPTVLYSLSCIRQNGCGM